MLTRATRWFVIAAPLVAGILLLIFGTAGAISEAFGLTLIGIALMVWMWNWFVRMSFAEDTREKESRARELYRREHPSRDPAPTAAPLYDELHEEPPRERPHHEHRDPPRRSPRPTGQPAPHRSQPRLGRRPRRPQ
jgi:hypothetical protein